MRSLLAYSLFGIFALAPLGVAAARDGTATPVLQLAQAGEVEALLEDLNDLVDRADRANAAHPAFLQDLRALSLRYGGGDPVDGPWLGRLLYDDFRDGDFTRNPRWIVAAGAFRVDTRGQHRGLHTIVQPMQSAVRYEANDFTSLGGSDNLVEQLIASVLRQPQAQRRSDFAAIHAPVRIPNSFAVRMELEARSERGRIDFGPYQSGYASGYRLAYYPGGGGLALLRVGQYGASRIATASRVDLEDNRPHVIEWTRDGSGRMSVAVDRRTVLNARDVSLRQGFDGFLIVNGGGEYYVRSVAVEGGRF